MADFVEVLIVARDLASGKIKDAATDVERSLDRMGSASRRSAASTDESSDSQRRLGREASSTERRLDGLARTVENVTRRLDNLGGSGGRGGAGLRRLAADGGGAFRALSQLAVVALGIPAIIYAIGAAGFGATAGIVALSSALATLSGFAVALPAALGGIVGAMAAIVGIVKPAVSGIGAAVQAAGQAKQAGASGGSSGGGGGGGAPDHSVEDAERRLKQVRQDNVYAIAQLERELAQARLDGVQRIIDAEQRLHDLKTKDAQQERQLQASLADARASAAGEAARGGEHQNLANALVGEAGADLKTFQTQARSDESSAQRDVSRAVQDRNQRVADVERRIARQRIENARALADAQRQLARAGEGGAGAGAAGGGLSAAQQAMQKLSPLQQQVAKEIIAIKDAWDKLTKGDQQKWLREILNWLQLIHQNLPAIAGEVEKFSDALLHVAESGRRAFADKDFTAAIGRVDDVLARGLGAAGDAGIHLGKALIYVLDSARPFLRWIEDTVGQWARYIEASAKVNDANGDLGRFFEHARKTGTQVGHIFRDLAVGLFNIGKISFPTGSGLLGSIAQLAKRFREFTESAGGRKGIASFFREWTPVFLEMARLIGNIVKDLKDFIELLGPRPFLIFIEAINMLPSPLRGIATGLIVLIALTRAFRSSLVGGLLEAMAGFILGLAGIEVAMVAGEGVMISFGAATFAVTLPMLAIVGVIALLVVGILLLLNHFGLLTPVIHAAGKVFDWLVDKIGDVLGWIKTHWKGLVELIAGPLGLIVVEVVEHWGTIKDTIFSVVGAIWDRIKTVFSAIWDYFTTGRGGAITGAIVSVFKAVVNQLKDTWNDIAGVAKTIVNGIIIGVNWVLKHIGLSGDQIEEWPGPPTFGGGSGGGGGGGGGGHGGKHAPSRGGVALGGGGPGIGGLPAFDAGGVVPGPVGAPTIALVHGGETILPTHRRGIGAGTQGGRGAGAHSPTDGSIPGLGFITDHLPSIPDLAGRFGALGTMVSGAMGWMRHKVFDKLVDKGKHWLAQAASAITGIPGDIAGLFTSGGSPSQAMMQASQLGHLAAGHEDTSAINAAYKIAALLVKAVGWGQSDYAALVNLWQGESGFRWWADNPTSDAYGIPQSLPGSKMSSAGPDWMTNPFTQIMWGLSYIRSVYGSPSRAYATWLGRSPHWYDKGGPVMGGPMGAAIPIIAHVGEWVLNNAQQMRLAQALGGLENAKRLLFDTGSMTPTYTFAGGGVVQNWGGSSSNAMQSIYAPVTVHSSKAEYDGDYLASVLERRFSMGG